ncbi:S-layer homology domain-containing protein [Tissierella pigra]|uniref:SLH domain-containing protein n=1 Tax=Tissierella pigra TaxID=2607614 RepID=A0A6N7XVW4_9FIRM|nr:S-layer homology domain-containing protein [Tissierella pigra]MSU00625.1 hypothetical protein [Tissierella pigra]
MKRKIAMSLVLLILLSTFSTAYANESVDVINKAAEFLRKEKVLIGDENGNLLLDQVLTRQDAVILLARLLGEEEEAKNFPIDDLTFEDIKISRYKPYLAWALKKGYFVGYSAQKFGFGDKITVQQFSSVLLRALGYDIEYKLSVEKAKEIGILKGIEDKEDKSLLLVPRGIVVIMIVNALDIPMNPQSNIDKPILLGERLNINVPEELKNEIAKSKLSVKSITPQTPSTVQPKPPVKSSTDSSQTSSPSVDPSKPLPKPNAPKAPLVLGTPTSNSITLNPIEGVEYAIYSIGGKIQSFIKWQDSNIFTGLTPDTEYTFIARIKETKDTVKSDNSSSSSIIRTSKASDIKVKFISQLNLNDFVPFGSIEFELFNLPNAYEYEIDYELEGGIKSTTPRTLLSSSDLPLIRYTKLITIRVYDSKGGLLNTFKDVELTLEDISNSIITVDFVTKVSADGLVPFGIARIKLNNLLNADSYELDYKLSDGNIRTTERVKLTSSDSPIFRYTENVTIRVYDSNNKLLKTFQNVYLSIDKAEPTIKANFKAKVSVGDVIPFGTVSIEIKNLPDAYQYEIDYELADGKIETTPITPIDSDNPPLIRYTEYVKVKIYDKNRTLIHTFEQVQLIK